jgi:CheY-like chemotaxis protein
VATILVADDDEGDRLRIASILRRAGHDVREAESGSAAMASYASERPDVVVTDLVMTGGDGLALIDGLRSLDPDVHVVAVSGKGREVLDLAARIGARHVLAKPVSGVDLLRAVESEP